MVMEGAGEDTGDQTEEGTKEADTDEEIVVALDDEDEIICGPCDPQNEEFEEAQAHRKLRHPLNPTEQERFDHRILHWPYRSWCRACVLGRGKHTHHLKSKVPRGERGVPSISIDFIFLGTHDVEAKRNTILVMYDNETDAIWAYRTGRKRITDWLIPAMLQDLKDAGYSKSKLCFRSDQEHVIKKIKDRVVMERDADTVPIESPVRESKCNGKRERAIQTLEGQVRTLLIGIHHPHTVQIDVRL